METLIAVLAAGEDPTMAIQRVAEIDARLDATRNYLHPSIFPEWIALCKERAALTDALIDVGDK
jgi:hypothetical protein